MGWDGWKGFASGCVFNLYACCQSVRVSTYFSAGGYMEKLTALCWYYNHGSRAHSR